MDSIRNVNNKYKVFIPVERFGLNNEIFSSTTFDLIFNNENTALRGPEPIVEPNKPTPPASWSQQLRTEETENCFYNNWPMNNTRASYCMAQTRK